MTSNMIYIVALGVGLKCPSKLHLNTQCPPPTPQVFRPSDGSACCNRAVSLLNCCNCHPLQCLMQLLDSPSSLPTSTPDAIFIFYQ